MALGFSRHFAGKLGAASSMPGNARTGSISCGATIERKASAFSRALLPKTLSGSQRAATAEQDSSAEGLSNHRAAIGFLAMPARFPGVRSARAGFSTTCWRCPAVRGTKICLCLFGFVRYC
eukprot:TRINITY_DN8127_c0_g1_i3.p1 TRINITY_DN8127_c0_g1~~TRINITY_DN8127_c0_g1_i3.p1  ORF type:complete len:121 (+),score=5.71 TRINITY_DN8127_c0_g1_i3:227-589(+)